jgi:osmotically inducible lipoprotein OsmB
MSIYRCGSHRSLWPHLPVAAFAALTLGLSACGYSTGDRAASGGLLGAGAGAAIGAASGGHAGTGALIGGGAGALGGALTSGHDVNLGRPIWR